MLVLGSSVSPGDWHDMIAPFLVTSRMGFGLTIQGDNQFLKSPTLIEVFQATMLVSLLRMWTSFVFVHGAYQASGDLLKL